MIVLNPDVRIHGIRPEMVVALAILDAVWNEYGDGRMEITACIDGTHKAGSLHYVGLAVDLRSRDLTDVKRELVLQKGKEALGPDFDFFYEGGAAPHYHCEFQPKRPY